MCCIISGHLVSLVLTLSVLIPISSCQIPSPGNEFIVPPPSGEPANYSENSAYTVGSIINLEWKTNYDTISLAIFQKWNSTGTPLLREVSPDTSYEYTVSIEPFDLDNGNGIRALHRQTDVSVFADSV